MDFVISSMDRSYCEALRNYHRALESRNRLLKGIFVDAEIEAFEWQIALAAVIMVKTRGLWAEIFGEKASRFYADSSGSGEVLEFGYKADLAIADEGEYFARISALRERDAVLQATSRGPHRDDLSIRIDGQDARPFASEGQQRGCVIALRLAQVAWFYEVSGVLPVILIDDILGELDGERSERFWASLPRDMQVFATGTENLAISDREEWDIIGVKAGNFTCGEMDDGPVESLKRPGGKRIWEG